MKFSDKAYINKTVLRSYTIIATALLLAYLLEWIKGSRTLGYTLFFILISVAPVVADFLVYRGNKETKAVSVITGVGYGIMYAFAVFTTNSVTPFTYAFPMFVVVTLFSDILYCGIFCGAAFLVNVIYVVYRMITVGFQASEIPDLEIRLLSLLITGIFVMQIAAANKRINKEKVKEINERHEASDQMMKEVLSSSDRMISDVEQINGKMGSLSEAMGKIQNAMKEVSSGNQEVAESIQTQMEQTEEIQGHIVQVKDTTSSIEDSMLDTAKKVENGHRQMEALVNQVGKSMEANGQVLDQMKELTDYTRQMNTIIETITNIADSTVMLSLNASIEAARAGEAGKGFAVVASEISALANQTMVATVNITELIDNINRELDQVAQAVNVVAESNKANAESTKVVQENFNGISKGTKKVETQTRDLLKIVSNLESANSSIVEKIQTISAITEQVSAHANETYEVCEANGEAVEETAQIVRGLNANAEALKNVTA
ncbi:MAG: methyl-accepting chemotaxis protein [Candidatus Gastranaerophilales bacterium]|nr:methyl-accepting chemotaxis protein [Candidatus Gastranaerophilales bacterium]